VLVAAELLALTVVAQDHSRLAVDHTANPRDWDFRSQGGLVDALKAPRRYAHT
jgi:hypothetical protein